MAEKVNSFVVPFFIGVTIVTTIVFFTILCENNMQMNFVGDSGAYLSLSPYNGVRPVYQLFVHLHKVLFGEIIFLQALAITQTMVTFICSSAITIYLRRICSLNCISTCIVFSLSLLTYTIDVPNLVSSYAVWTEALTYPLFYIFIIYNLKTILDGKKRYMVCNFLITFILSMTRSQLQLLWIIAGFTIACAVVRSNRIKNRLNVLQVIGVCIVLVSVLLCGVKLGNTCTIYYQQKLNSDFEDVQNTDAIWNRISYTIDEKDVDLFEDEHMRGAFLYVYHALDELEYRYVYRSKDLWTWHDVTLAANKSGMTTTNAIYEYFDNNCLELPKEEYFEEMVTVKSAMTSVLLRAHWDRYLYYTMTMVPSGFISTVFVHKEGFYILCHLVTAFLYISALIMSIICWKKKGMSTNRAILMLLVIATSCIMIGVTNLVFMGLQRYLYYIFGIFYIAYFLLLEDVVKEIVRFYKINIWEVVKFGLVGISGSIIAYAVYSGGILFGLHYQFANVLAFFISVTSSFFLNGRFVFGNKIDNVGSCLYSMLKVYLLYSITGVLINGVLLYIWIEKLHIASLIAPWLNAIVTIPINYFGNKIWVFNKR